MNIFCFIEDSSWVPVFEHFYKLLSGTELSGLTLSKEIAMEVAKYFDKTYLLNSTYSPRIIMDAFKYILSQAKPQIALFPSTNKGRAAAGIYMGLTGLPLYTDVYSVDVEGNKFLVNRLVYGGTASATISVESDFALAVLKGSYKEKPQSRFGEIVPLDIEPDYTVQFKAREVSGNDPSSADIVVVAGRGIKKREDMKLIEELAGLTGGAWSVTRPLAADYRWADQWIGISGLTVSPKVYIAFGVSGQPHHLMGARGAKYIIAVNTDREAPIFEESDLGIVGDLYKVLPRLIDKLKEKV